MNRRMVLASAVIAFALSFTLVAVLRQGGDERRAAAGEPPAPTPATIAFWETRVEADRADFVSRNQLADALLRRARQSGDLAAYQRAASVLDESLAIRPTANSDALVLRGQLLVELHDFEAALALAERAIAAEPGEPAAYAVRVDALSGLGRYEEALTGAQKLAERAPGLATRGRLAFLYERFGDLRAAEATWIAAIEIDTMLRPEDSAWARVQLGHFYRESGRPQAAERWYEQALELLPHYVHAQAGLAGLAAAEGDLQRAIGLYAGVVERAPSIEYAAAFGDALSAAGREAEAADQYALIDAIDALQRASGIRTDLALAVFLANHRRDLTTALDHATAAYMARPSIEAADTLAWALHQLGRSAEALPYIQEALRLGTQDARLFFHAGMIHAAVGQDAEARRYLDRVQELNPRFSLLHAETAVTALTALRTERAKDAS